MNQQHHFTLQLNQNKGLIYLVIGEYCKNTSEKEDLFQDICLAAWKSYPSFSGKVKFSSWVSKIARNITISRLRKAKIPTTLLTDNLLYEITDTPYEEIETGLSFSVIDKLTQAEKQTLYYRMDGLTFAEISTLTGEPINRLLIRMHRIKRLLSGKPKNVKYRH